MGTDIGNKLAGTPGKRVHVGILLAAAVYMVGHAVLGTWLCALLLQASSPFLALMVAVTLVVAFGNVLVAAPLWVYSAITLLRGPRPIVTLPKPVPDLDLPQIIVQVPGRHEASEHVRRSIDSVLGADYPPDKLRVQFIDNSDDERWTEVARHYQAEPRVRVEHRDGTKGFKAGNLNVGLERLGSFADPERVLIGLLDVGDTFAPKVIRPMATEFVHDERLGFVQGMFRIGNPRDTIISWSDSYVGDAARRFVEGYIAHYGIPTLNGHCVLLRLAALEDSGGWDGSRVAEDWSAGITMMTRGWAGKWVDYEPTDPAMVSTELVPGEITGQQKQKRRWATGGTELAKLHLLEWMRSPLPWNQRFSVFLRLAANFSVLPGFVAQLLFPMWIAAALLGEGPREVLAFGIISALVQNPFMLANTMAALNYARERNWRTAISVVIAYPVQALWRLPLFSHAAVGIIEGLSGSLKDFVITPKSSEDLTVLRTLMSQRLVIGVSLASVVPLIVTLLVQPRRTDLLLLAAISLPILTICALFLVPMSKWISRRFLTRDQTRLSVPPAAS
ncbi:MAG: glycosyltransferase [Deltaproteobacteria bacterium]|nr:glycosyltransferase [Deltaproteobacteria bacterium]